MRPGITGSGCTQTAAGGQAAASIVRAAPPQDHAVRIVLGPAADHGAPAAACANPKGREIGFGRRIRLTKAGRGHPMYAGKDEVFNASRAFDEVETVHPACVLASNAMSESGRRGQSDGGHCRAVQFPGI